MGHSYKTEGIVLKRKNFGEADRILTIYSKHYGKIRVIAKGVRWPTSRKAGSLELFNQAKLVLAKGKSLDIISETQLINSFRSWRRSLPKVGTAYYFCELVDRLTADGQEHRELFELLGDYLRRIASDNLPQLVRNFEEKLLKELGFGIPPRINSQPGSLRNYLEEIAGRRINSPKIIKSLTR